MEFKLDDHGFSWVSGCRLSSWTGFLDRGATYGGGGADTVSDGWVEIVFAPEGRDASPLDDRERAPVQWFLDNEPAVSEAVQSAVAREYPRLQMDYDYSREERARWMPDIGSPTDLRALIGLHAVNVHQIDKGGTPYLGFEFGCTWDGEHGLGVLMHGTRVVEVGGAETALLLWMAEQDAAAG